MTYRNAYSVGYTGSEQMIYTQTLPVRSGHRLAVLLHGRGQDCHFSSPGVGCCTGAAAGAAATPSASPTDSVLAQFVRSLADAGFGVAQIDGGGPAAWGNAGATSAIDAAVAYARSNYGAGAGKLLLLGFSMGDITALNYARLNPAKVAGLYMLFPACDLDYHQANNFPNEINAAFSSASGTTTGSVTLNQVGATLTLTATVPASFPASGTTVLRTGFATYTLVTYTGKSAATLTGSTIGSGSLVVPAGSTVYHVGDYAANAAGRNPALFAATVAAAGIPWRGWYSTADAVVPAATAVAFAAAYGPLAKLTALPGNPAHGSAGVGLVDPADLLSFAGALAY